MEAIARAYSNVALVKYFGKRDLAMNLPAAPSLSLTVSPLHTTTKVVFDTSLQFDEVRLNGAVAPETFGRKVIAFLDIIRRTGGVTAAAMVSTENNFPTAAGLASSASGFAALTVAALAALDMSLSESEMSALSRRGSGSACRSITGGVSIWEKGDRADGRDSYARSILAPDEWDLRLLVGVTQKGPKAVGSTEAMEHTRYSSIYYSQWIESAHTDVHEAAQAVQKRDFEHLGEIAERSALSMHAALMAARPGIVFLKGPTLEAYHAVREWRRQGIGAYFSCDAGPQPKVLCLARDVAAVKERLIALPGVLQVISCLPAGGAHLVSDSDSKRIM